MAHTIYHPLVLNDQKHYEISNLMKWTLFHHRPPPSHTSRPLPPPSTSSMIQAWQITDHRFESWWREKERLKSSEPWIISSVRMVCIIERSGLFLFLFPNLRLFTSSKLVIRKSTWYMYMDKNQGWLKRIRSTFHPKCGLELLDADLEM